MRFPRASGVLLHPTSLPGPHGSGDLGPSARHFVDWLVVGGQGLWQVLPLGDIGPGNSPYMSPSAFAGNVLLVDLGELHARGARAAPRRRAPHEPAKHRQRQLELAIHMVTGRPRACGRTSAAGGALRAPRTLTCHAWPGGKRELSHARRRLARTQTHPRATV